MNLIVEQLFQYRKPFVHGTAGFMPARAWFSVAANRAQPCTIVAAKQHGGHFEHKLGVRKLSYVQLAVGRKAKLRIRVAQIRLAHAICLYDMEPPRTFLQTEALQ